MLYLLVSLFWFLALIVGAFCFVFLLFSLYCVGSCHTVKKPELANDGTKALILQVNLYTQTGIGMHILHAVLYTFAKVLIRRICLIIKSLFVHFLYCCDLNV